MNRLRVHNHKHRPTLEIVFKGSVTEVRGDTKREGVGGETMISDRNTTHWWRNVRTTPAIFTAVDVFRKQGTSLEVPTGSSA